MDEKSSTEREIFFNKKTMIAIMGVIIVGLITSGLYDLVVKPGVSFIADWSYNLISVFSETIENAPFSSAALNPTVLPSLIQLIFYVAVLPGSLFGFVLVLAITFTRNLKSENKERKSKKSENAKIIILLIVIFVYIIFLFLSLSTIFSVVNKSIFIYRVFQANIAICTPHIAEDERNKLLAEFAKMESKDDYMAINKRLEDIAKINGIKLRQQKIY